MRTDGQHAIDAISAENAALKTQLDQASRAPAAPVMPPPAYGPGVTPGTGTTTPGANRQVPDGPPADAKVSMMSFETGGAGPKKPVGDTAAPQLLLQDSPDYLPPNSYAPARVIVGVDASTGVASQTDPLPGGAADHWPGTLGHAPRQGADDRYHRLPRQRRGPRRYQQRESLCEAWRA
jgi:conjugal transfer pilus assembly protein TraB